jgi:hypothetical protein
LAAAKRSEKTAERELKEAAKAAEPKKKSKPLSSRGDVVVEEVGSDEEDLYEGRIEEEEEADSNEMTDHTPETRNAVRATQISLSPSLSLCLSDRHDRCIERSLNKRKKKQSEIESTLQRTETMRKSTARP